MDFIEYANNWAKSEVTQGQIMIGLGVLILAALVGIIRSEVEFLKGATIPIALMLVILIGYGGYILFSRPAHAKESIALFQKSEKEAIEQEIVKHTNDNKAGKTLMKIYPILAIVSLALLMFLSSPYYKGMAVGFGFLFLMAYVVDNGFVSRSDAFLEFLNELRL